MLLVFLLLAASILSMSIMLMNLSTLILLSPIIGKALLINAAISLLFIIYFHEELHNITHHIASKLPVIQKSHIKNEFNKNNVLTIILCILGSLGALSCLLQINNYLFANIYLILIPSACVALILFFILHKQLLSPYNTHSIRPKEIVFNVLYGVGQLVLFMLSFVSATLTVYDTCLLLPTQPILAVTIFIGLIILAATYQYLANQEGHKASIFGITRALFSACGIYQTCQQIALFIFIHPHWTVYAPISLSALILAAAFTGIFDKKSSMLIQFLPDTVPPRNKELVEIEMGQIDTRPRVSQPSEPMLQRSPSSSPSL